MAEECTPSREIDFAAIPLLRDLDRISLVELIPSFEQVRVKSGDVLYRAGEPGDAFFIIVEGIVRVFLQRGGRSVEIACLGPGDWFGEMALLRDEPRNTDVEAQTELVLLKLSRTDFRQLIKKYPSLAVSVAGLLAAKLSTANELMRRKGGPPEALLPSASQPERQPAEIPSAVTVVKSLPPRLFAPFKDKRFLSFLLAFVLCFPSALFLKYMGMTTPRIVLMELLVAATVFWSMKTLSFHTVSIALPVAAVLLDATTPAKAFSGFSSATWFLVLAVFGISASVAKTGLLYRLTLMMMKRFPRNYFGQAFAVALSGLTLTPVIPSPNGRIALASPLILTLSEVLGYKKGSGGAVGLAMATFLGYGNLSQMFMNGSFVNFFMLGLLPPEVGLSVTWGYWFKAAVLLSLFFFLCSYLAIVIFFRPAEMKELVSSVTDTQLRTLGPVTMEEKVCLLAVLISLAGFLTQSWHNIDGAWIAMLSLLILFAFEVLDQNTLRSSIDWAFVISLGALIGFGNVIAASGLPEIVATMAKPYLEFFAGSRLIFLLFITVSVVVIRLVLPAFPSLVVCILALLPISATLEISPLVIGIIVLFINEPWFLPHQSMIFQTLLSSTEGRLFEHRQIVKLAFFHVLFVLAAIAVSFPYWKYLGLIR
jgi:di/tricarboxylate transporter/CRP-like cAMP-binding protein